MDVFRKLLVELSQLIHFLGQLTVNCADAKLDVLFIDQSVLQKLYFVVERGDRIFQTENLLLVIDHKRIG
jgi:hypothetical protein